MKNWYFVGSVIFGILFIISASFLLASAAGRMTISNSHPLFPQNDSSISSIAAVTALVTSIVSLLGTIATFIIAVRKERRDQDMAKVALEQQLVTIEKEKLELEKLRQEMGHNKVS